MITNGWVEVGGSAARNPALAVDEADVASVAVDGEPLDNPGPLLVMLHKPVGYVCSHDEREGPRAYDLLPERWLRRNPRLESIGRLDKDSSGLLLLTDDHQLVHRLASPKHHLPKRYVVTLDEPANAAIAARFASGELRIYGDGHKDSDDKACLPAELAFAANLAFPANLAFLANDAANDAATEHAAEVVLYEGRYRQVRRMFAACERTVLTLHRTHMGPYELGSLAAGEHAIVPFLPLA